MPKISIIATVYNIKDWICRGIDSVLAQHFADFELIIIDDGSTDGSGELCEKYCLIDERVKVIHQQNSGISAARNKGFKNAKGEYIAYFDPDDWVEPDYLGKLLSLCENNNCKISCCNVYNHYINGKIDGNDYLKDEKLDVNIFFSNIMQNATFGMWDKLWHRSLLENFRLDETIMAGEDLGTFQIYYNIDYVATTKMQLYHYCYRSSSVSHTISINNRIDRLRIIDIMLKNLQNNRPEWLSDAYCLAVKTRRNFINIGLKNNFPMEIVDREYNNILSEIKLAWPVMNNKLKHRLFFIRYLPFLWYNYKKIMRYMD